MSTAVPFMSLMHSPRVYVIAPRRPPLEPRSGNPFGTTFKGTHLDSEYLAHTARRGPYPARLEPLAAQPFAGSIFSQSSRPLTRPASLSLPPASEGRPTTVSGGNLPPLNPRVTARNRPRPSPLFCHGAYPASYMGIASYSP